MPASSVPGAGRRSGGALPVDLDDPAGTDPTLALVTMAVTDSRRLVRWPGPPFKATRSKG
jgi:hypothetical protein